MAAVEITRVIRRGHSMALVIPEPLARTLGWRIGDRVAVREANTKLVLQRVPLEQLAKFITQDRVALEG